MIYKPRCRLLCNVPVGLSSTEYQSIYPAVHDVKWTKNNWMVSDEMSATVDHAASGIDPRTLRNARIAMWMWDEALEDFDEEKHLRFTGMAVKVVRKLSTTGPAVEIVAQDHTSLFINMKPYPTDGYPDWTDTLDSAWKKICDHTGFYDKTTGRIISSVAALRDKLICIPEDLRNRTLGEVVNDRFHAISKPTYPHRCDAWAVWKYIVGALGLYSYIDKDTCVVTTSSELYKPSNGARFIYGQNILNFEESADPNITMKGVHLTSIDPLTGKVMEAFYPDPSDERIKKSRTVAGRGANPNNTSTQYEPFEFNEIHEQKALEAKAAQVYEDRKRQELEGKFTTREMVVSTQDGKTISLLDLRAGDAILIGIDQYNLDALAQFASEENRVKYLVEVAGYEENLARLIAKNLDIKELQVPFFHVSSLEISLGPTKFEIDVLFHNIIISK